VGNGKSKLTNAYGYQKIFVDGLGAMGYGIASRFASRVWALIWVRLEKLELTCSADRLNRIKLSPARGAETVSRQGLAPIGAEPEVEARFLSGRAANEHSEAQ
jgi:hypothetical protein